MTKKILSIAAAASIVATSSFAFDIYDDGSGVGQGLRYVYNNAAAVPSFTATASIDIAQTKQQGDALIFPAYFAGGQWETNIKVINTSPENAVVAKVVLYSYNDSKELRDFNIYLSANDVWEGTIKTDADGTLRLISTDDSAPLEGNGMASVATPMKTKSIDAPAGYVAVIGCAMTVDTRHNPLGAVLPGDPFTAADFKNATAHGDHVGLRRAYKNVSQNARGITNPIFAQGVITNGANVPNVNLNTAITTTSNAPGDNRADYFFTGVDNVLAGVERITDTVNGKDMVMPAIRLQNVTQDASNIHQALLYIEGEAAHIADRTLTGTNGAVGSVPNNNSAAERLTSEYHYAQLAADAMIFNTKDVYITHGDALNFTDNRLLLTSPYKRILVNSDINFGNNTSLGNIVAGNAGTPIIGGYFTGVKTKNGQVTNYGRYQALALIFDQKENMAQGTQFSPANTPILNFNYELSLTESNPIDTDNLSHYLTLFGPDFEKGYTILRFLVSGNPAPVSVIPTQMMATEAAGKTVTNWIVPTQK